LTIVIFGDGKGGPATAGYEEHLKSSVIDF
jgi:hypothetical protein